MIGIAGASPSLLLLAATVAGARHALDLDHICVIDGIARHNVRDRPMVARMGGILFALGHVLVIATFAAGTALLFRGAVAPPRWLGTSGLVIAATMLLLLGVVNLFAGLRWRTYDQPAFVGIRSRLIPVPRSPAGALASGAALALSLDTASIGVAISAAGTAQGSIALVPVALGCFAAGMILVSGVNGLLVLSLLQYAGRARRGLLGAMTFAYGVVSTLLGAFTMMALMGL